LMMAAISPAFSNYTETVGTLRFATMCKSIVTKAHKNEESKESIINDLKGEIERLKQEAHSPNGLPPDIQRRLDESEALRLKMEMDHASQLEESKQMEQARRAAMEDMGLSFDEILENFGMKKDQPQLVNISDDPSLNGCLVYFLPDGDEQRIGCDKEGCNIVLDGLGIKPFMCSVLNEGNKKVTLQLLTGGGLPVKSRHSATGDKLRIKATTTSSPQNHGRVLVNGRAPETGTILKHMDRLIIGHAYCLRCVLPAAAARRSQSDREVSDCHEALAEVVHDDQPEFIECRAMMDSLQDRVGHQVVQAFIKEFGQALPLVQEANLMTSELRADDHMRFQIEVCSDIMTFTSDEPELIVRFYQGRADGSEQVIDVFEWPQFLDRLESIREVYNIMRNGDDAIAPWETNAHQDPWATYGYKEVQEILQAMGHHGDHPETMREENERLLLENMELRRMLQERESGVTPDVQDRGLADSSPRGRSAGRSPGRDHSPPRGGKNYKLPGSRSPSPMTSRANSTATLSKTQAQSATLSAEWALRLEQKAMRRACRERRNIGAWH